MTHHDPADATAPEYVGEHVRQAVATDPRTTEQGIGVRVVHGEVFLSGEVGSADRRAAIGVVAEEAAQGHAVHNGVTVAEPGDHHVTERIT